MLRAVASALTLVLVMAGCAQMPGGSADTERLRNAVSIDDVGYLQEAVRSGKVSVNQRIPMPGYQEGAPLITVAARYGSLKALRYLISAGANINARTPAGETALMLASYFSEDSRGGDASGAHEQVVRALVEAGASLENEPHNYTPLAYAAYQGHDRIVRYLIERGARVDGDAEDGVVYVNTPLMMAAIQGHADTAMWLLRAGADPRVRIYLGSTAAELAMKNNHRGLITAIRCAESLGPGEAFVQKCAGR
jgi:hypothetical protein